MSGPDRLFLCLAAAIGIAVPNSGLPALPEEFREVFRETSGADSVRIPLGRLEDGRVQARTIDGEIENVVLRVEGETPTLDLLMTVAGHLNESGYREIFRCHDRECGGFDFISEIEIVAAPEMYVDIGDFRYLSAGRDADGKAGLVGVVVSRSMHNGFIQITAAQETARSLKLSPDPAEEIVNSVREAVGSEGISHGSMVEQLVAEGHAALSTLEFAPGSLTLENGELHELEELAEFLKVNSNQMVFLVGHTDASGTLESNIELSRKRAGAVQEILIERYGVNPEQLMADGIGYLSPRATNLTEEGRARNRRVEAILVAKQ